MQEQQDNQYSVTKLGNKNSLHNGNGQRLSNRIESSIMQSVNFDTTLISSISSNQTIVQNQTNTNMVESNYAFKSKGKYTNQFFKNNLISKVNTNKTFKFDECSENKCAMHGGYNDIVVLEPYGKFAKYQAICRYCESEYNRQRKAAGINSREGCILMIDVIKDNVDKILNIRNGQLSITNQSDNYRCTSILYDELMPLADELIDIVNDFNQDIFSKFNGSVADNEELLKIKNFIDQIPLINGVEPNVNKIEEDPDKKIKYVKLAIFLLNYTNVDSYIDCTGISLKFKESILRIVYLRRCIVETITKWLRFVLGDFYEFVFSAEKTSVDEAFRRSIKIDFFSEEDIKKLTYVLEAEIFKRDARIRLLEEENERYKRELDSLKGNLCYMNDQESMLNDLRMKFQILESEYNMQKNQIGSLTSENNKLITQNAQYFSQINILNNDIETMRINFENTLKSTVNEIRIQFEMQITRITEEFNDLKNKYQHDAKQWVSERESLTSRIEMMITEINEYKERINDQIGENNNLNGQWQRTKNELIMITQERDNNLRTIEALRVEIKNYQLNITNFNSQLTVVVKTRDDLSLRNEELNREINKLKSSIMEITNELQNSNQKIEMNINSITIITKERDELMQQFMILKGEFEKKSAECKTLVNIRISLESRINQIETEIRRITDVYTKLQYEYNQKIVIIGDLENRVRELDGLNFSQQSQNDVYITNIQKYEKLLIQINEDHSLKVTQLEKIIAELREKERELIMIVKDRDNEIARLKTTITACKEDWNKLSESYESLLIDIKNQININEVLRNLVFELLSKIEMHNQNVSGIDIAIKQQIEALTRQSLSKKNIDIERNYNQDLSQATVNIDNLRMKLGRIESQKLHKSAVFSTINFTTENINQSSVEETTKMIEKNNNLSRQSTINIDIKKYIDNVGFNIGDLDSWKNSDIKKLSESVVREVKSNNVNQTTVKKVENFNSENSIIKNFNFINEAQTATIVENTKVLNQSVISKSEEQ